MIAHVVLAKPRANLSVSERDEFIETFERAVREIPSVRGVRVGRRITHGTQYEQTSPDSVDFLILLDFDDLAGLQTYLRHPAHEAVGALFRRLLDSGWAYDFEVGDVEVLREMSQRVGESR